jgi:hypothetical protein
VSAAFVVDARIMPLFTADAVIAGSGEVFGSWQVDADILATMASSWTADAIRLKLVQSSVTADARIMPIFTVDAVVSTGAEQFGSLLADAIVKASVAGSATTDAIVKATRSFDGSYDTVTYRSKVEDSLGDSPSWTHSPGAENDALVVCLMSWVPINATVTYGTVAMSKIHDWSDSDGMEVFFLSDLTSRSDDVVRVTGAQQHGSSIMMQTASGAISLGDTGQTGSVYEGNIDNQDRVIALDPFTGQLTVTMAGTPNGTYATILQPLSTSDHVTRVSLGGSGEGYEVYTGSGSDGGFYNNGTAWTAGLASTFYAQRQGILADAIIGTSASGSFTTDAVIARGYFTADAVIVSASEGESTLGDMTLGDNTLGG